jgi:protein TonB
MPQELLRDVFRTGDATARARRRWSILPLSIAAHAVAVSIMLIAPLAAEVDLPPISSPIKNVNIVKTVTPPSPPPPRGDDPRPRLDPSVAPIAAPDAIIKESPPDTAVAGPPGPPGGIGVDPWSGVLSEVGTPSAVPTPPPPPPPNKPFRVGQGIREPQKILHVPPEYPQPAVLARVEGTVVLEAVLDETGKVDRVRVLNSVPLLNGAAIRAVQRWRYTPTLLNGVPVQVLMTITVKFTLSR